MQDNATLHGTAGGRGRTSFLSVMMSVLVSENPECAMPGQVRQAKLLPRLVFLGSVRPSCDVGQARDADIRTTDSANLTDPI
jgi:hypothetical protein